jgi:hypothetical protein
MPQKTDGRHQKFRGIFGVGQENMIAQVDNHFVVGEALSHTAIF